MGEDTWISSFLAGLGAPDTQTNRDWVSTWIAAEGPWSASATDNNPLNIESPSGGFMAWNSAQAGGSGTAAWLLQQGYYTPIVDGLRAGNPANAPGLAGALSWWSGGGGNPNNLTEAYKRLLGVGGQAPGPPGTSAGAQGWLGGLPFGLGQDITNAENAIEGIAGGIFGGLSNFLQILFGGNVSPFLRLPQALINIGWNFGGFSIGVALLGVAAFCLLAFVFEEGFSLVGDALGDSVGRILTAYEAANPPPQGAVAIPANSAETAEAAEAAA